MNRSKKNVRLNIYLTYEDKKKLNEIKFKYQLSYSTIARLLGECIDSYANNTPKLLNERYLFTEDKGQTKTSIKPRKRIGYENFVKTPTIYYTNAIKLYTREKLREYMTDKNYSKFQKELEKAFKEEKDPNWNGNEWQRRIPRLIRQNKEYYKKILESE